MHSTGMTEQTPLAGKLRRRIEKDGPMPLHDYMQACLADPEYGYYLTRDPLGARGDFITAPEISQIFGELIGLWCAETWRGIGAPAPVHLLELGPGRGTLMADALRAAKIVPGFLEAVTLHLVETSPALRALQKANLAAFAPQWHDDLSTVPEGAIVIVANEFLDALPVRQFERKEGQWFERRVGVNEQAFLYCLADTALADETLITPGIHENAAEGDIAEIRPGADELMEILGRRAAAAPLAALFIDYGHARSAPGDTFQAVAGHSYADPLMSPGERDLTAHVDFEALAASATRHGLKIHGPVPQGAFLLALGLAQRCKQLMKRTDTEQRETIETGARRLVDPHGMGELFKALSVTAADMAAPPAFGG